MAKRMNALEAKKIVSDVFSQIKAASSVADLNRIIESDHPDGAVKGLQKTRMSPTKYPKLDFVLTKTEIDDMKRKGQLTEEGALSVELSSQSLSPLEKLLYAVLWKNGDLGKEKHIVDGVSSVNSDQAAKNSGLVFFQFGKHLADRNEPIIDQHVLRAFALYLCPPEKKDEISRIQSKSISKDYPALTVAYKDWLVSDELRGELKECRDYVFAIDKVLFALGKAIKLGRNSE